MGKNKKILRHRLRNRLTHFMAAKYPKIVDRKIKAIKGDYLCNKDKCNAIFAVQKLKNEHYKRIKSIYIAKGLK